MTDYEGTTTWLERKYLQLFSVLKLIEIVILWVHYTIPFGSACLGNFGHHLSTFKITLFG